MTKKTSGKQSRERERQRQLEQLEQLERQLEQLERQLRRHAVKLVVRCDLVDPAGRAGPASISSEPDVFCIGLMLVKPDSNGGRELCAALNKGDLVHYRVGLKPCEARVATKGDVSGSIWLHAVDVARHVIMQMPVRVLDDDDPRLQATVKKHARGG